MRLGYRFAWRYRDAMFWSEVESNCKFCRAPAVVRLPDALIAIQPDDTTHVCHPAVGGCNQGFSDRPASGTVAGESAHKGTGGRDA